MSLVKMSDLCRRAREKGVGCGSFSVYSMEALIGTIKAAERLRTPVIIQLAEARFQTAPLELVGPMMVNAAKTAKVDVAVHLDHGKSLDVIARALELGFTSVMYDGSTRPFHENMETTRKVMEMAKPWGAAVEAELGLVGTGEGGGHDYGIQCTSPEDARIFAEETGVDALAIAIGNKHGNYPTVPKLRFDILRDIHEKIPDELLVLHGGSGIADEDFQQCIRDGITKINIATATLNGMVKEAAGYLRDTKQPDYYGMSSAMVKGAYETVSHHIRVFQMEKPDDLQ